MLVPKVGPVGRRGLAGRVPHEPFLPGFEELLAPPVMQIGIQAFAATESGNALPAAQALWDDPELLFRRMSWTTFSAGFAWLRGTSSPGGKVSLISPPHMIHIRLNPHSVTIRARAARGRGPDDGAGQLRVPPTCEAARSL